MTEPTPNSPVHVDMTPILEAFRKRDWDAELEKTRDKAAIKLNARRK